MSNEIYREFLRDPQIADKFNLTEEIINEMKIKDVSSHLFINIIKACMIEHGSSNKNKATKLKQYIENNIPNNFSDDMISNL